ncbi:phosphoribosylglycinamide formyltransferase [Pelotalea chapellei]|uniref:Phosphoribosylglycinamide formyltransferase n=1 Tax=Pelotalea chapellei TaxID=44671 RepID=A0ABS5U7K6_9BACT|nr:phosphoribosylglycinamide formyltransferase [Pelotalea chapellei]MBT1071638.1 phosphoribosylglycinamide formyltransferase [Pelotalea chapellei]
MITQSPLKLAVLVSGNGSNLQAIIDAIEAGSINARITCVVSNNPDAFALKRAIKHGVTTVIHQNQNFSNRREYDSALVQILKDHEVELVILAGFMRLLSEIMVNAFPHAIVNIHPALLPAFPGLHAQKQALDYGVRYSGCTVHLVDCGTDTGPIILQAVVPIEHNDTEETLSARIQREEHRCFPEAIRLFADGKIQVNGRHVHISP